MSIKRGAMFGLDARIALAIFGALSVISGAALYSAIESAKSVSWLTKLSEFSKAIEHYYLDIGYIPVTGGSSATNIGNLYTNYELASNWNGPYFGYGSSTASKLSASIFNDVGIDSGWSLVKAPIDGWNADYTVFSPPSCTATDCQYWINMYNAAPEVLNIYEAINEMVDGDSAYNTGKIRLRYPNSTKYSFYYLVMPVN